MTSYNVNCVFEHVKQKLDYKKVYKNAFDGILVSFDGNEGGRPGGHLIPHFLYICYMQPETCERHFEVLTIF